MKVTIGLRNVARELNVELDSRDEEFFALVTEALENSQPLVFTDMKGQRYLIPSDALGYIESGSDQERRVGFAL
ncbi:MAG: ATP-binding protein [Actinobacteria bacterium]|nr:MAG: ATP-binding protein [Actinomycetota bacterium]